MQKLLTLLINISLAGLSFLLYLITPYDLWGGTDDDAVLVIRVLAITVIGLVIFARIFLVKKLQLFNRLFFILAELFAIYKIITTFININFL